MTTNIIPFAFESREVRTILIDNQPWFVAMDVSNALAYTDTQAMTRKLDEDEMQNRQIVGFGPRGVTMINESGLYSAILRSRKPEAKRFKKWVTAEVLPAIRKYGHYQDNEGKLSTLIGCTIGTDGFQCLAGVLEGKVRHLPLPDKKRVKNHIWSQVHKAFSVVSAQDIPADKLDSARNFIAAYQVLEGELLIGKKPEQQQIQDVESIEYINAWLRVASYRQEQLMHLSEEVMELNGKINDITNRLSFIARKLHDPIREPIIHMPRPKGYSSDRSLDKSGKFFKMQEGIS